MVNGKIGLGRFHDALGYTGYALPLLLIGLIKSRLIGFHGKWILGVGGVIASLLTLWQMRWRDLYALLLPFLFAVGICECVSAFLPFVKKEMIRKGAKALSPALVSLVIGSLLLIPWIRESWLTLRYCPG